MMSPLGMALTFSPSVRGTNPTGFFQSTHAGFLDSGANPHVSRRETHCFESGVLYVSRLSSTSLKIVLYWVLPCEFWVTYLR